MFLGLPTGSGWRGIPSFSSKRARNSSDPKGRPRLMHERSCSTSSSPSLSNRIDSQSPGGVCSFHRAQSMRPDVSGPPMCALALERGETEKRRNRPQQRPPCLIYDAVFRYQLLRFSGSLFLRPIHSWTPRVCARIRLGDVMRQAWNDNATEPWHGGALEARIGGVQPFRWRH